MHRIGIDIGSTTVKVVAIGVDNDILFSRYERHNAKARETLVNVLKELSEKIGDDDVCVSITGSVGMGISEQTGLPFIQEVVAAVKAIQKSYPETCSMIDIGGEDAKIVFFKNGEVGDLRMNGNCAGGTGAFIDQMAVLLGVDVAELNKLALEATQIYPIASRCGVFCKTDIQNLIAKNVSKADIAASIFRAVAVQTVVTLAHGYDIETPVLFCGGPLTFIPALRKAFLEYLGIDENGVILPQNGTQLPAFGAALSCTEDGKSMKLSGLLKRLEDQSLHARTGKDILEPIFSDAKDYQVWKERISSHKIQRGTLHPGAQDVFIGIDSGSTTTKIVVTDTEANVLYSYYEVNAGNPIATVEKGLLRLKELCEKNNTVLHIKGSCSTGYGEDLIRTAFQLDFGIVETMAHYLAASHLDKEVSFILDIGGQDMKAMFVDRGGIINRIEINEACSSGCGSFIETFAKTLNYTVQEFTEAACRSKALCDLGTRCTVFMNSKVKQVLREGATIEDIAAGLAYSVIKNCIYKVLKLKDISVLGKHIVVQGGTMRNDAVARALELLTGTEVTRCDMPELMGAYGCALYARENATASVPLDNLITQARYTSRTLHCKGCDNQCLVVRYRFENGKNYYSGNRCEKVFTNGESKAKGANMYAIKKQLLFDRNDIKIASPRLNIGIPRCLNMYENFPFWHKLFTSCGIQVSLSDASDYSCYERNARMVMSDNICFPAKLVHSHIQNLIEKKVDRIFMPFVIFERQQNNEQNSYNCPIVTGYSEVVKSVQTNEIPIDSPAISFKDEDLLYKQCRDYLSGLGIDAHTISRAFKLAETEQAKYADSLVTYNKNILEKAERENRFVILLAGRPYHTDPLIQHDVSEMIAEMGIDVITDDIVRGEQITMDGVHFLPQWTYPNRILKAAKWCSGKEYNVQFVELTSFGCGPDAFLTDEVRDVLVKSNKPFTLLKLDDINNVGSMKLRIRSLVESLKLSYAQNRHREKTEISVPAAGNETDLHARKIIVPYFTPFISPLIPAIMRVAGYDVENLPLSDAVSCDYGLKYANNEVCYPATLIVGDVVKAFESGKYDPDRTVVAMVRTGGQCRASNYIELIKKALADAGYGNTPVVSLTFGRTVDDGKFKIKMNWVKILPIALRAILYSDCISKFYSASLPREKTPGQAAKLRDLYLSVAADLIKGNRSKDLFDYLALAAKQFNEICRDVDCPKVGVVGEIFLKFNPFAHKDIEGWLSARGIEVVPSVLLDFFMQNFVNRKIRKETKITKSRIPESLYSLVYGMIKKQIDKVNRIAAGFRYFIPFGDIFEEAENAEKVVTLNAQFGEGWLLPAEIISLVHQGVTNVISLQPFGCIANHVVSKGIEKRIKALFPEVNILSLDFDGGVSDVNIANRLLLFVNGLEKQSPDLDKSFLRGYKMKAKPAGCDAQ